MPLAWKWQLPFRDVLLFTVVVAAVGSMGAGMAGAAAGWEPVWIAFFVWLWTAGGAALAVAFRFYRDPDRTPPADDGVVVSPADGEVIYVHESRGGLLPEAAKSGRRYALEELTKSSLQTSDATVVGIGLNFLDVHVSRAPIAGRVVLLRRYGGRFGSLRRPEMVFENERVTIVIQNEGLELAVVLIASRLVRRIVAFVEEGDTVILGQRIGAIRFGSQVDLVFASMPELAVVARVGERVVGGESVLGVKTGQRPGANCGNADAAIGRASDSGSGEASAASAT